MLSLSILKQLPHFTVQVNLQVDNEIVVLFGPSGSGKTTILNCIAGLVSPEQGKIVLNHQTLFGEGKKKVPVQKRNIGYLFQDYALFPHMTVQKNIAYGMKNETLANQLIEVLKIGHLLNKYPRQISGGEKQRVALTRALASEPDVLLLDEPFSALDSNTRKECHQELLRLHKMWSIPVIMVTHDEEEAKKLGNRMIHLKDGHILREEKIEKENFSNQSEIQTTVQM
ncbi:molybdate transport system ATP-binding protein [Oikeobacillus pervagus]|uniref:Molybdate transport system ATP-binding protein n=1 Tax=Oikeobacillus pervagus TaxID=1325931 RepID=A0AAJ1WHC4_9BACI|nr:ATP-binding cassette domain-containing protein [Oikeobacillus pervagus]MDQ0216062.1 molybdate transport system ATP-binding protein [Oikeobacillus pervagus]